MKTEVTTLYEARKDKTLMRVLYSLTLRGYSEMRFVMHTVSGEHAKDCVIIFAKEYDKIVGWSIIYLNYANFYVARAFRRKGIGTILYNKAREVCGKNILCSAWDKASSHFFTKHKAKLYGGQWRDTTSSSLTEIFFD